MLNNKKIYALIPARGGSTRLPLKNILPLNGKPLISYTIEQAKKSKYIDRVIVSTDNEKISEVSKSYNAEVPFLRPENISGTYALPHSYITHFYNFINNNGDEIPYITVLLQPTSPLRTAEDIDKAIELFNNVNVEEVISVCASDKKPFWYRTLDENGYLVDYTDFSKNNNDKPCYILNGAIYAFKTDCFKDNEGIIATKVFPYEMPPERSIDIDRDIDFELAELLLKRTENC